MHLQILKSLAQFFAFPIFQILEKYPFHNKNFKGNNLFKTIIQISKHKAKYLITACIPKITIKNFYFFFKKNLQLYKKNFFTMQL